MSARKNQSSEKEIYFLEIIICDPLIYTMVHPDLTVSNFMRNSIGRKKLKTLKKKKKLELSENLTIAPLQCLACSKRPECLRILRGNVTLTSIKGQNSLTYLRKMTANNPNVDIVSINIKFGQNLSICSQDIDRKPIF